MSEWHKNERGYLISACMTWSFLLWMFGKVVFKEWHIFNELSYSQQSLLSNFIFPAYYSKNCKRKAKAVIDMGTEFRINLLWKIGCHRQKPSEVMMVLFMDNVKPFPLTRWNKEKVSYFFINDWKIKISIYSFSINSLPISCPKFTFPKWIVIFSG